MDNYKKQEIQSAIFQSREYKHSRAAYVGQETCNYFIHLLLADAYLATLLSYLGISDAIIGIIASLVSFAFLFQLFAVFMVAHLKNTKRSVLLLDTLSNFVFLSIYLVPFLKAGRGIKTVIVIVGILLGYLCKYLIQSLIFRWGNTYVAPNKRGEFSAVKEMVSLISGIVFSLIAGHVIDYYESIDQVERSFLFIAVVMLIINVINFISILCIKNESSQKVEAQKRPLKEVLQNTLGNRNFVNVIIMSVLYQFGLYLSSGFMGIYKTSDLLLSVGMIQIINMVGAFCRMICSKPFGRYSDRTSFSRGYRLALLLVVISQTFYVFCAPRTWWLIIPGAVLYNISLAGSNSNNFNMTYSYVKAEYIVQAMAIKQRITGVIGFVAALIGGSILQGIQQNGNRFLGIPVYGQQLLCALSIIFIVGAILFNKLVIEKQKRLIQ